MRRLALASIPKPSLDSIRPFLRGYEPSQTYPRGTELFSKGAPPRSVFVLVGGMVRLQGTDPHGRPALLALRTVGSMLGAPAALANIPYAVTASTVTPCEVYRLPDQAFRDLIRNETAFSWHHHQLQAYEILQALNRIAALSSLSAPERLEAFLDDLAEELLASLGPGEVPLRDHELAQIIAVTPSYLSRLIKKLVGEGRLRREHGVLFLNQPVGSPR